MILYQMHQAVVVAIIAKSIFHLNKENIKILQDHRLLKLIMEIIITIPTTRIARVIIILLIRSMIRK